MRKWLSQEKTQWRLSLTVLSLGAAMIYLWDLAKGLRSEYYAAIAMAMSKSFSNLFFGTLDPGGSVTLDKIPGSYWIPAIFVKLFGFSTWAVNAPNALATIGTVIVVSITGKNLYGKTAGLIAGAIFATTPIVAAVARSNQPQSYFLLTLSLAGWASVKALQHNSRKHLIIAGAWIALAFHTYMLEAWAIWPALIAAYFFTDQKTSKKFLDIFVAGFSSLLLSLTWIVIVALIPASHRPYIGGTYHNNPFEMVFGYNGLGRFTFTSDSLSSTTDDPIFRSFTPPFGGSAGIDRLFNYNVGGQIAWLIPTAITSIAIVIIFKQRRAITVFYTTWAAIFFAMFSAVSGIHQFYVSSLALPIAALISAAIALAREHKSINSELLLLGVTAVWTFFLASRYSQYFAWAPFVQGAAALIGIYVATHSMRHHFEVIVPLVLILGITTTPSLWALDSRNHPSAINPIAGPIDALGGAHGGLNGGLNAGPNGGPNRQGPPGGFNNGLRMGPPPIGNFGSTLPNNFRNGGGFSGETYSQLISYLKKNRNGAKYLLATFGAQTAARFITQTGEPILPIGGFDGQDPTPSLAEFQKLVSEGQLRFVLANTGVGNRGDTSHSQTILSWVASNCTIDTNTSEGLYLCQPSQ